MVWLCGMDIWYEYVVWIYGMDIWYGYMVWMYSQLSTKQSTKKEIKVRWDSVGRETMVSRTGRFADQSVFSDTYGSPWEHPCFISPPFLCMFCLFFASLNFSFGLIREALHRFDGCAKIWSAPGSRILSYIRVSYDSSVARHTIIVPHTDSQQQWFQKIFIWKLKKKMTQQWMLSTLPSTTHGPWLLIWSLCNRFPGSMASQPPSIIQCVMEIEMGHEKFMRCRNRKSVF